MQDKDGCTTSEEMGGLGCGEAAAACVPVTHVVSRALTGRMIAIGRERATMKLILLVVMIMEALTQAVEKQD